MPQTASLLMQLNDATRRWHAHVDEPWLELLRSDVGEREYVAHLVRMYGFEAPLEGACAYTPGLCRVIDRRRLRRAGRIAQDLLALGMTPSELATLPQCFAITPFQDVPESLGWLYVVERSTLHHDQVRRSLQHRVAGFGCVSNCLATFDDMPDYWERFGNTLDRVATRPDVAAHVIDAAHVAFECMQRWFQTSAPRLRSTA